ncbi:MAG: hypothetical protein AAGG09_18020 [Pseudomonadota bacterium]
MPKLVRLYIIQTAIGFAISAAFVAMLLFMNVANLWHLVTHTGAGPLAVFLLWLFNGIVFSGVQFGISVMLMAEPEDRDGGKRDDLPVADPLSIRIDDTRLPGH